MGQRSVVVAVDGSESDLPALSWAAEEAVTTDRPLLITHAAGHLPPSMTYAERHVARAERRAQGSRVVDRAAEWVRTEVPGVSVDTMVRLLDARALLPAVGRDAHALTQTGDAWTRSERGHGRAPVVALTGTSTDTTLMDFAAGYAARHGVDLVVVDGHGPDVARRLLERRTPGSLLLLPRPDRSSPAPRFPWPMVLDIFARSRSPVALVAPSDVDTSRVVTA